VVDWEPTAALTALKNVKTRSGTEKSSERFHQGKGDCSLSHNNPAILTAQASVESYGLRLRLLSRAMLKQKRRSFRPAPSGIPAQRGVTELSGGFTLCHSSLAHTAPHEFLIRWVDSLNVGAGHWRVNQESVSKQCRQHIQLAQ
jgi:hypothetical protein